MFNLTLFFTRRTSLQTWVQNGYLEREISLYLHLQQRGVHITFVTYGGAKDLQYAKNLNGIEVLCNKWHLPQRLYERLLPFLFPLHFLKTDAFKTNQTKGAEIALRTSKIWRKPLIARCGYMWSEFAKRGSNPAELALARRTEKDVFSRSTKVSVTTKEMKRFIVDTYGIAPKKIQIIPNYVLTDVFSPNNEEKPEPNRISFIGRLVEQKNLLSLLEACAGLDVDLHFVGEGYLRNSLQKKANEVDVQLTLYGALPHHQLPSIILQSVLFVLVSTHEGHPKSLIEAMSCGVAVVGTDVPGIREIIQHGENGWLCGTAAVQIRQAIQTVLGNRSLQKRLGENARKTIVEQFSLDRIVELELDLLQQVS